MSQYHLGFISNVKTSKIEDFIRADYKIMGDLSEIPKLGPKSIEKMNKHGINTTFELVAAILDRGAEWNSCLEFMRSMCATGSHPPQILLIILFKLGRFFKIPEAPAGWDSCFSS